MYSFTIYIYITNLKHKIIVIVHLHIYLIFTLNLVKNSKDIGFLFFESFVYNSPQALLKLSRFLLDIYIPISFSSYGGKIDIVLSNFFWTFKIFGSRRIVMIALVKSASYAKNFTYSKNKSPENPYGLSSFSLVSFVSRSTNLIYL